MSSPLKKSTTPSKKTDYCSLMDKEIEALRDGRLRPKLTLHLCCAPCSSYVIGLLEEHFDLVLYFYDPNIQPKEEYERRRDESSRYADERGIAFVEGPYDVENWNDLVRGYEDSPERGERCRLCYGMRMAEAARFARGNDSSYFTTVLSISPHKDAVRINEIGFAMQERFGVKYLPADFKKKEGFKKSIDLSRENGFYRQDYCGCIYSKRD